MKVLVVGSGGREHALCWALAGSPLCETLWCAPGNAGIAEEAACVPIAAEDIDGIVAFAKEKAIDFVVVGPAADPAKVGGMKDAVAALRKIAAAKAPFASRGDDSGTHKKEKSLWKQATVDVAAASGGWYRETGSGMGATLNAGVGMGAYVLTDRATWISFKNKGDFTIQVEGDKSLFNQYGIILVNPEKHKNVKAEWGQAFVDWMLGKEGQSAIATYKVDGQQLFFPNAQPGS